MSWSQTGRILLIWPEHGHVLNRQLDLILVKRYAVTLGAQLALVTHDSEVSFFADQIGIPVFGSTRLAQDTHWRDIQRRKINPQRNSQPSTLVRIQKIIQLPTPTWLEHPITRFFSFGLSVLALLALGIFILPSAKIVLSPQDQIQSMRFDIIADPSTTSIIFSTGSLPTYIQDVIVEGRDTITSTGYTVIPDEHATGSLSFTNTSTQKIKIPAGTIVSTPGSNIVRFITSSTKDVMVNPNQSVLLDARALTPGSSGNLPPEQLVKIEGDLGLDLTVTNPLATQGGTDVKIPSPSAQDLQLLDERLRNKLKQTALMDLQSTLPDEDTLILPTLTITETLSEISTPAIGEPSNQLELSLRLTVQSQVVSGEVLHRLVTPIMDSNTPNGYLPIPSTLEIIRINSPTLGGDGKAHWTINATRKLQTDIPAQRVIDIVKGVNVSQASERLSVSLPIAEQAQIVTAPSWWPRLPFLAMRIEVVQPEIR